MRTEYILPVEKVEGGCGLELVMVWPFVVDDTTYNRIDFDDIEGNLEQELTSADASQTMIIVILGRPNYPRRPSVMRVLGSYVCPRKASRMSSSFPENLHGLELKREINIFQVHKSLIQL